MSKKISKEFDQILSQIATASGALNKAAEAATNEIEAVEKRLLEIEPGVSVWTSPIFEGDSEYTDEDGKPLTGKRVVKLGFAKTKKWGITYTDETSDSDGKVVSSEQGLLRKADRDLRLLGRPWLAGLLDAVLNELTERVDKLPAEEEPLATDEAESAPVANDGGFGADTAAA